MILAKIHVTLKASVLDPEGTTVTKSLHALGYDEVEDVRIGKYMEVKINTTDRKTAEERVTEMCERLLANTVIEKYSFELTEV
ncbi:phosphoribosylformylglycinamidine synthase subunit PurS [Effusibacillus lacus]|uniref:Phosphoribosylformylglycinamidine synthase subunit PurS n=1 Tax=Effusibacillus lacus TaxID=1348429 RepID=A0A292YC43_9BACL|nr:phosphoribosylformylglycinamidine synthase subunit PurS [Effusibacillus lacus]TCS74292.1 phosphoribosylformylglycinamidine synthase [Effusibacillus lacus]GAX88752.1 phosphoribosylformylglycinamidine synthase subunit PurS [Effusibacillus lacus]